MLASQLNRRALASLAGLGIRGFAARGAKAKAKGGGLDLESYEQNVTENVVAVVDDVVKKYLDYNEAVKDLDKPLGNISPATVQAYCNQVKSIEQKTGFSVQEAILDEYEVALIERNNSVRSFLDYIKEKVGASMEINTLITIVDQLEEKYKKEFIKGQDKAMDKEYEDQAKEIGLEYMLRPLTNEELDKLKLKYAQTILESVEKRAKTMFSRQLSNELEVGEIELLQRFADAGLDFTAEFKKVFDSGSATSKRLGLAIIY
eukprot:TRINITY_DN108357_c0_g1_i4.p2 TRINITY_DN108357_c0_g1~~TRINITY_DN108357_c0_g1_i4.p2  ORF type:complete len:279 (-),score=52.59 TRINITY_DN108357_c0_g1_i4:179-961(-)